MADKTRITLLHSVTHNRVEYAPGEYEMPTELAEYFCAHFPDTAKMYHPVKIKKVDPVIVPAETEVPADPPAGGRHTPLKTRN